MRKGGAASPRGGARRRRGQGSGRPRLVLVGEAPFRGPGLAGCFAVGRARAEELPSALVPPPAVVVLDGGMGVSRARAAAAALEAVPEGERPGVVLVLPPGEGRRGPRRLRELADEVAPGQHPEDVAGAARRVAAVRHVRREIALRDAEIESLKGRLETLSRRMAEELRLASKVQRSPVSHPWHDARLDVAREFLPFREIGGDYYDFVPLGSDRLAFVIGDVMGKGVPAALLAANLKASIRAQLPSVGDGPEGLVRRVNRLFWEVTPEGLFATLFFGVFDLEARTLEYVNAGHHHPFIVRRAGEVEDLGVGGTVLGLLEEGEYERGHASLGPSDVLVFYSDGVTDRSDRAGETYGVERLKAAAVACRRDAARIALYTLLGEVQGWSDGMPADDDATLIVVKVR